MGTQRCLRHRTSHASRHACRYLESDICGVWRLRKRVHDLERLTKPLESCLAGGKIADMTRRKEIPIALWKRIEPLIPQV
ncbi:hypothetical protein, partial [Xanthomonas fragariae]|uniref:hypothetical protein n=1 Tax=Xanthomonas fragariae TaxID=48664 RepID=UPI00353116DC